jgi:hypothetical protein
MTEHCTAESNRESSLMTTRVGIAVTLQDPIRRGFQFESRMGASATHTEGFFFFSFFSPFIRDSNIIWPRMLPFRSLLIHHLSHVYCVFRETTYAIFRHKYEVATFTKRASPILIKFESSIAVRDPNNALIRQAHINMRSIFAHQILVPVEMYRDWMNWLFSSSKRKYSCRCIYKLICL